MPSPVGVTDRDLLSLPRDGRKYELVDGQVRVSPAGARHGEVIVRLTVELASHVRAGGLGRVFDSSTGYRLPGGNLRSPDVSFVATGRLPAGPAPDGFLTVPPDLAVEVLSPEDDARDVLDKVGEYLRCGVRVVWIVDPKAQRAAAYRSLTEVQLVPSGATLEGGDVVPGFSCALDDLLA